MNDSDSAQASRVKDIADKAYAAGVLFAISHACETIEITGVDFDPPYTTVHWANGDKTMVKDQDYYPGREQLDPRWHEYGISCALCKRVSPDFASIAAAWSPGGASFGKAM